MDLAVDGEIFVFHDEAAFYSNKVSALTRRQQQECQQQSMMSSGHISVEGPSFLSLLLLLPPLFVLIIKVTTRQSRSKHNPYNIK